MRNNILFLAGMVVLSFLASCKKEDPDKLVKDGWEPDGSFVYGGKLYGYIYYGDQVWMIENLAWLPSVSPPTTTSTAKPVYYVYDYEGSSTIAAKASENYKKYGVLYNWKAAITACPTGWHLPSDEDWKTLERFWGMNESEINQTTATSIRASGSIGYDWKSTSGWYGIINEGCGINYWGFNVKPGGFMIGDVGKFNADTFYAFFWTSTESGSSAYHRLVQCWEQGVRRDADVSLNSGMSIRCVKD